MPANKVKNDSAKSAKEKEDSYTIEMKSSKPSKGKPKGSRSRSASDSSASSTDSDSVRPTSHSQPACTCVNTCLHIAARNGDTEQIQRLLRQGADPSAVDRDGRTPLHLLSLLDCSCVSCIDHSERCMNLLLQNASQESLDTQDVNGDTPLSLALEAQNIKCAQILIDHGADYSIKNIHGKSPIGTMGTKTPDLLHELLDNSVTVDRFPPHNQNCVLNLDFRPVVGSSSKSSRPSSSNGQRKELNTLYSILEGSKISQQLLCHPLIAAFLYLKWHRVRKYFVGVFVCYIFWLITYTSYIVKVYLVSCPCEFFSTKKNVTPAAQPIGDKEGVKNPFANGDQQLNRKQNTETCLLQTGFTFEAMFLIAITFLMASYEIFKIILISPKVYFKNKLYYCSWILIIMVFITTGPVIMVENSKPAIWQYEAAALAIFISWAMILVQLGTFPMLGRYVEILGHVLKNFARSMLTFTSLFVAFALSFNVLFPGEDGAFSHFFYAILKVFVMMAGEVDYQDMFYDKEADTTKGPLMGHILYAAFVIIISIVLMNLMIGLTVSDIQTLQSEAEIRRISRQIRETVLLECFAFSKRLPKFIRRIVSCDISVLKGPQKSKNLQKDGLRTDRSIFEPLLYNTIFQIRPNDRKDKSIPENVKQDLLQIAVQNYHNATSLPPSTTPSQFHSSATSRGNTNVLSTRY